MSEKVSKTSASTAVAKILFRDLVDDRRPATKDPHDLAGAVLDRTGIRNINSVRAANGRSRKETKYRFDTMSRQAIIRRDSLDEIGADPAIVVDDPASSSISAGLLPPTIDPLFFYDRIGSADYRNTGPKTGRPRHVGTVFDANFCGVFHGT
ncbi:hypothetical protein ACI5KX_12520 [Erythrobacter sp. GH1-10]|uniref:hypothetical protein n=1 Tax=Erythrobacter sp. GH1-10 TaxID=3349334 RepID=UPI003877C174